MTKSSSSSKPALMIALAGAALAIPPAGPRTINNVDTVSPKKPDSEALEKAKAKRLRKQLRNLK